ncbi:MAG: relaxase/mobilization nuclease domain-containing protein [Candidatus Thiodiazotropha sp.]
MILHGNQRGGGKQLALHLLKDENEQVEIHELRGFVADNLRDAFHEIYAVSRGTKAKQYLFSLSLNPPPSANVPTSAFEDAIARVEKKLGLQGQPRAIVFHEKEGRRHCHAVFSRIDTQAMKAIPLSHSKRKLMDVARALFREHGWTMPRGLINSRERDPRNFSLAQWQQAKRQGKDPRAIKEVFQECWAASDNRAAFAQALEERGYRLAQGDRRGFVALDYTCEVYAVAKWAGVKAKDVTAKLGSPKELPGVSAMRETIAREMSEHLSTLQVQQDQVIKARLEDIDALRRTMATSHRETRTTLREAQKTRREAERRVRQARFHKGLRGLLDHLTGTHRRIKRQNEDETRQATRRDQQEKDALVFRQLEERHALQARIDRLRGYASRSRETLSRDREQYRAIQDQVRETLATTPHRPTGTDKSFVLGHER